MTGPDSQAAPSPEAVRRAARLLGLPDVGGPRYRLVLCCDFDGTLARPDLCNATLERFADATWLEVEERWLRGELASHDALRLQYDSVRATPEELARLYDAANLAAGFEDFLAWARDRGYPLFILSDGLDIYIRHTLGRLGLADVPFFANRAEPHEGGLRLSFPHHDASCARCGACKCAFLLALRPHVERIVYFGDGLSDTCAAARADLVYARDRLAEIRDREGLPYRPFEDFRGVREELEAAFGA